MDDVLSAGMKETLAILGGCLTVSLLLRIMLRRWIRRMAESTGFLFAEHVTWLVSVVVLWAGILFGVGVAVQHIPSSAWLQPYVQPVLWSVFILVLGYVFSSVAQKLIEDSQQKTGAHPIATSLIRRMVQIAIYILAGVMILDTFDIKVTTIIATLGIGGLALALALQDTLTNLFAGIYITVSNHIKIGQAIVFEGNDGTVVDIGWRSTIMRKQSGAMLIVPNSKLSQAIVTTMPQRGENFVVSFSCFFPTTVDIAVVQTLLQELIDTAVNPSSAQHIATTLANPAPTIRIGTIAAGSIELVISYSVSLYETHSITKQTLLERIVSTMRVHSIDFK